MLKLVIQKSGRLHDETVQLLQECDIRLPDGGNQLRIQARGFPLVIYLLRNSDIPRYLESGTVDLAILGQNTLVEENSNCPVLERLGFARCRLSLAVPNDTAYSGLNWLQDRCIATSYPGSLRRFLGSKGIQADIHEIGGSVEVAPKLGLADAICDLVSSGSTLFANGLKEVEQVLESEACLAAAPVLAQGDMTLVDELLFRIRAVLAGRQHRYVLLNAPSDQLDAICQILPGLKSPTVTPLAVPGWVSVQTVLRESEFWPIMGSLRKAGAEGILVMPIEKLIA
ncbi:MAG: ATP phosphoribosyltransferase [Bacteroidetes bacterium]|nr:ATP phosphoribosyltransferase [Bacteroidota bacterium]